MWLVVVALYHPGSSQACGRSQLVPRNVAGLSGPVLAHGLVARVWPLAAVRALVPLEASRGSSPELALGLVARVRPLAAVRARVRREVARHGERAR
jgi:hypothetical protein